MILCYSMKRVAILSSTEWPQKARTFGILFILNRTLLQQWSVCFSCLWTNAGMHRKSLQAVSLISNDDFKRDAFLSSSSAASRTTTKLETNCTDCTGWEVDIIRHPRDLSVSVFSSDARYIDIKNIAFCRYRRLDVIPIACQTPNCSVSSGPKSASKNVCVQRTKRQKFHAVCEADRMKSVEVPRNANESSQNLT